MNPALDPGTMSIAHLLNQSSGLALLPPILLLLMSIGTGYYLLFKSWNCWQEKRLSKQFLQRFWHSRHLQEIQQKLHQTPPQEAYARLTASALDAASQLARREGEEGYCCWVLPMSSCCAPCARPSLASACAWKPG